mmetsp:Transcript_789/g.1045  ORF Transcript_789/g.1045 Transcript_789/m.1045 type:complete len:472 (-) Transcript_789:202-1617(-)|eukprot:CAMPEP_0198145104 /NCGR_PEP_ID=MMETSP1443-20131203/21047_1 /TAXON_ID=186043 /ORGANISM="Entomoneis sp., Strain CCMP2396" /LENGTH=471 /DNA_ID=CAMNT_0043808633 /DNA_START=179 /DNA_END=1594 /DNA_ORIENTATION=-
MDTSSPSKTDITVYGATSFTAKHVLAYLLRSSLHLPKPLKVTLAGRNEGKLKKLKDQLALQVKNLAIVKNLDDGHQKAEFDIFVAESSETDKLKAMAARTRVILNCAGPFSQYSSGVVSACAETGTDYVDITGEVHWASDMREMHGDASKASGSRIIHFCGVDSIPSDVAVFTAFQELRERTTKDATIEKATTWYAVQGLANAGTIHTVVGIPLRLKESLLRFVPFFLDDPLALTHPTLVRKNPDFEKTRNRLAKAEWYNQLPAIHSFLMGGFSAPFFMSAVNHKVVHETGLTQKYGPNFVYYERFLPVGFKYSTHLKAFSVIPVLITQLAILIGITILKLPVIGIWLAHQLFPMGTGPKDEECQNGFVEVYAEVEGLPDKDGKVDKANCFLKFKGDPGNWVTAQCVSEAALCLLHDRDSLPTNSLDGFGSPAELLGNCLLDRLRKSKVRPVHCRTNVRKATDKYEFYMFD